MSNANDIRKYSVFRAIVREYLDSAEPVGSGTIVSKYHFGVSPATIRNDMVELEQEGFIEQPHTSAGRIPTEIGYRFYVTECVEFVEPTTRERAELSALLQLIVQEERETIKDFARGLSRISGETVIVHWGNSDTYLTGTAHLFEKPEARDETVLRAIAELIDNMDRAFQAFEDRVSGNVAVLIGTENPFGGRLASVLTKCQAPALGSGLIGIVGPWRMDYDANLALMRYVHNAFEETFH